MKKEAGNSYHAFITIEHHAFCGVIVWTGFSLDGHTNLHVFADGSVTVMIYQDEVFDPFFRSYADNFLSSNGR